MGIVKSSGPLSIKKRGFLAEFDNASACSFKDGLTGAGIPFHRPAEPRIDVGRAFGDQAEFQRASGGGEVRDVKR